MKSKILIKTIMKKVFLLIFLFFALSQVVMTKNIELISPNGKIKTSVELTDKIYYSVYYDDDCILEKNSLTLSVGHEVLGEKPKLKRSKIKSVNTIIKPAVPLKFSEVKNGYNELLLYFNRDYSVEFRAFNDGVSYRFITNKKGAIKVFNEEVSLKTPQNYKCIVQYPSDFNTNYEEPYSMTTTEEWGKSDKMVVLPLLFDTPKGYKILMGETDVSDYPRLFMRGDMSSKITSVFPKFPLEVAQEGDRSLKSVKEADYIAETQGERTFPWRYFVIVANDKDLLSSTIPVQLAPKQALKDVSWIHPGQVSWEWWNGAAPYGEDVNFVSGYNLDTYKYYIDFASKYGVSYIIMDEGWAKSTEDPFTPNPKVDVHEIIRYGKDKNVGVILWLTWLSVENNIDKVFKTFAEWGVKGVKIDFMDRSDQWMVNYYERVAKEAAKHQLLVDFHGSFTPAGLEYKYPNLISYEGLRGMEQMGGCHPDNSIYLPFIRNVVGAMDYTPGAMISMQPEFYCSKRPNSASIGTRAYQMALFVVFESGLQMLADNPTLYYRNSECTEFIVNVPTTWDETVPLVAELGEVVAVAKRKGDKWYIGAMTNNKKNERTLDLDLDFLNSDKTYIMTYFEDGINAHHQAMDYRRKSDTVKKGDSITVKLVRNGGWAAIIE